jgi:uncharacterized membrane protein
MSKLKRICRHLLQTHARLDRTFPFSCLVQIENEIKISETRHDGEIRFVVEAMLSGAALYANQSSHDRAIDLFAQLRMWDTEYRNGVLIYVLLADKSVEIVADRGVDKKTGAERWQRICQAIENAFRAGQYQEGVLQGIREVDQILTTCFPAQHVSRNELSNKVVVL